MQQFWLSALSMALLYTKSLGSAFASTTVTAAIAMPTPTPASRDCGAPYQKGWPSDMSAGEGNAGILAVNSAVCTAYASVSFSTNYVDCAGCPRPTVAAQGGGWEAIGFLGLGGLGPVGPVQVVSCGTTATVPVLTVTDVRCKATGKPWIDPGIYAGPKAEGDLAVTGGVEDDDER